MLGRVWGRRGATAGFENVFQAIPAGPQGAFRGNDYELKSMQTPSCRPLRLFVRRTVG